MAGMLLWLNKRFSTCNIRVRGGGNVDIIIDKSGDNNKHA